MADDRVSERVSNLSMSAIKEMAILASRMSNVASLTWGVPSFRTPEHIRSDVARALEGDPDIGKYTLPGGLPALRRQVVDEHLKHTGMEVDPDRNVVISAGNMEGLNALFHVLLDPGDEIIVTDPGFASHFQQIRMCGGVPVYWPLVEEEGWAPNLDVLPSLLTDRTKAILLVTPSNPTGRIFRESELRRIGALAKKHDLFVLLDDPYHHFVYENRTHYFNLASVADLRDHMVYLFTFSKAFALSGWRVGYIICPESLRNDVVKVHDSTMICAPRISQVAALSALRAPPDHLLEFERVLGERRDYICARLDRLPHVFEYMKPEGTYYVFPRITAPHNTARQFALDLLDSARVCVTPGDAFGPHGEHHVRMAFCGESAEIEQAFDRIEAQFPP